MMNMKRANILRIVHMVLSKRKYFVIALFSTLVMLSLYIISFSFITPRILTDIGMVKSVLSNSPLQVILIILLTFLFGIWIAMQFYLLKEIKTNMVQPIVEATSSIFSGFLGGLGAVGGCPACLVIIAAVIGSTATTFIFEYRTTILLLAIALIILSIYTTSKSIENKCKWCK
ncbi:hypothetical protein HYX16_02650 [Candidatus Woesearchaeota archaeon]|nr:hypothetical protein [Candidatus Woesearchaeota archaeon]